MSSTALPSTHAAAVLVARSGPYSAAGNQQGELNLRTRRLTSPTGISVELTVGEFSLLTASLRSPQQLLSREQLLAATHLHDEEVDRSIDVQILRLCRKLRSIPARLSSLRRSRVEATCLTLRCNSAAS